MIYSRSDYFNLLRELVRAQFRLKDKSTILGIAWSLLHPIMLLGIIFLLFSARIGKDVENYGVFLLIGLVHYTHFATSTSASMKVLVSMRKLTADAVFPKELLVIASVLMYTVELVVSFLVCLLIAVFSGVEATGYWLLLPLVWMMQIVCVLWVSFFLSCTFVFIQDMQHFYQVFLRILLFVTPMFYGLNFLGDGLARELVSLNPLAAFIGFSRGLIIDGTLPTVFQVSAWLVFHGIMLFLGLALFRYLEPAYAEKV